MSSLLNSVIAVLQGSFGSRWPYFALAILALAFWPILAFAPDITLDKAHFTEEWVKTSVSSLLLYFILQATAHHFRQHDRVWMALGAIDSSIIPAIKGFREEAQSILSGTTTVALSRDPLRLHIAVRHFDTLFGAIATISKLQISPAPAAPAAVLAFARKQQFVRGALDIMLTGSPTLGSAQRDDLELFVAELNKLDTAISEWSSRLRDLIK